ncbi:hypothetical protein CDL12_14042 [Handroanthus impetiginosus]|uniref:Protein TILLER ANGLE CONTROL 1 n=1 Tax=Handroanthus impetiginosus TaxID=429701 RepID=A0A2G9H738_9LAMI|nr:hypothetical protein CDL12_14042 [Handroanthus impetiginosus]
MTLPCSAISFGALIESFHPHLHSSLQLELIPLQYIDNLDKHLHPSSATHKMKIFNWVHRRFNNKLAENAAKKNGLIAEHHQQLQFMVENNTSVFERWRGGILTIGTFGYDPLKDENEENDACFCDQEESDKEHLLSQEYESTDLITADCSEGEDEEVEVNDEREVEEEANPLDVYAAAYAHEFERLVEGRKRVADEESEFEFKFEFEYVLLEKTTKKARTTLADLFSADAEELQKKQEEEEEPISKLGETTKEKLPNNYCKQQGFSFGKKLMVDEARPIHKLHQLVRRMLKRKIHPDDHASLLP